METTLSVRPASWRLRVMASPSTCSGVQMMEMSWANSGWGLAAPDAGGADASPFSYAVGLVVDSSAAAASAAGGKGSQVTL